jgi:hypothetical protein
MLKDPEARTAYWVALYDRQKRSIDAAKRKALKRLNAANYEIDLSDCADEYEEREAVKEYLNEKGYGFCGMTDEETIIYQQF